MVGILLVLAGAILLVVYFIQSGKEKKEKEATKPAAKDANKKTESQASKSRYTKNSKEDITKKDLFEFMDFEKIQDDMIVQEKGTKFTMVLQCKGINYDLMSEVEQLAVEEGFITFLNTLKSPIQLYVQARAIDLKTSLDMYKERVNEFNKEYEEQTDRYNKLASDMNTSEEDLKVAQFEKEKMYNISEYAHDITRYVEKLSLNKHMLQRKFYVVMSYYKSEINATTKFSEEELFDICYRELYTRAQGVVSALQTCSVSARVLDSNELAELIYITYNRDDQKLLDIRTALESGFYRMYTTTQDIHEKKKELLKKQIQEEAMNRLEIAIKTAIEDGRIISDDEKIEAFENDVDRTAVLMAEELDMDKDLKENVQSIIVKGHQKAAKERQEEREKRASRAKQEKEIANSEKVVINENKEENKEESKEEKIDTNEPKAKEEIADEKHDSNETNDAELIVQNAENEEIVKDTASSKEEPEDKKEDISDAENDSIV